MSKLIPILLAILGLGAGIGTGLLFRPETVEKIEINPCGDTAEMSDADSSSNETNNISDTIYVKLNNQFVVPVVSHGNVNSLVVLSLTLAVSTDSQDQIYQHEPRLRDAFLQVLFEHANSGGFDGAFTSSRNMELLRNSLKEVARKTFGDKIQDVLIEDLVRQDV